MVSRPQGFTLLEILLVVLIVAIMASVGVNLINNQSIERQMMAHTEQLEANIKFLCEQSILENHAYGIEWTTNNYHVLRYQQQEWLLLDSSENTPLVSNLQHEIRINGLPQRLVEEAEKLPHVVCQADGSFNAFEFRVFATESPNTYYTLASESRWRLQGEWHHE